jgi:isopenicillin-N epimerase
MPPMSEKLSNLPALGRAIRHEWPLDWRFLTVNHGSFGATPLVVTAAQDAWRRRLEEQPSRFMRRVLPDALRHAATRLAEFVGAAGDDIVFVENATVGCNAVLRSLRFHPGDEIVVLSHVYGAVRNTVGYVAERSGARIVEATLPFPNPTADSIVASVANVLSARTGLAVLDHITSSSALVLPIERLAAACRAAGALVLVDGAHGPGQVGLDLPSLGVDWYVGNCHKWLMPAKGCAFLWARPDRQQDLHPVTISHGFNQGFAAEFDWTGTRDPSAFLAVDAAIDFHHRLGGGTARAQRRAGDRRGSTSCRPPRHRMRCRRRSDRRHASDPAAGRRPGDAGTRRRAPQPPARCRDRRAAPRTGRRDLAAHLRAGL